MPEKSFTVYLASNFLIKGHLAVYFFGAWIAGLQVVRPATSMSIFIKRRVIVLLLLQHRALSLNLESRLFTHLAKASKVYTYLNQFLSRCIFLS